MTKVVAKALITNNKNQLLVLYRSNTHPNFPGQLDLPGGEVKNDEHWVDAVAREIREETAIIVSPATLKKILEKQYSNVKHVLYITKIDETNPIIELSWEHSAFKWYKKEILLKESLPKNVDPYFIDVIQYLRVT